MLLDGVTEQDMREHYRLVNGVGMNRYDDPEWYKFIVWGAVGFFLGLVLGSAINLVLS